jgi:hypothetical protein
MAEAEPGEDAELLEAVAANLASFGRYMQSPMPEPASLFAIEGHGYGMWTRAHADSALEATLPGAGFVLAVDLPVMVLTGPPSPARALSRGVEVRRVTDAAGAADFRLASLEGSAGTDAERASVEAVFGDPAGLLGPAVAAFVAYVDGVPAAAALSFTDGQVSRIAWVGTVPAHRDQGLGTAVTRAAVCAGFDLGGRFAVLESSPIGESVYLAMGFRPITRYRIWLAG